MEKSLNFRVEESEKEKIKKGALQKGMKMSELIRQGTFMLADFDKDIWKHITLYADALKTTPSVVIQNIIIDKYAKEEGKRRVYGSGSKSLHEFVKLDSPDFLTGKQLFDYLSNMYEKRFVDEREKELLEAEPRGYPLDEEEKAFMIKRRKGRAWFESNEYRQAESEYQKIANIAQEARDSGLVPEGIKSTDFVIAELWKAVKEERMTKEEFKDQMQASLRTKSGWKE